MTTTKHRSISGDVCVKNWIPAAAFRWYLDMVEGCACVTTIEMGRAAMNQVSSESSPEFRRIISGFFNHDSNSHHTPPRRPTASCSLCFRTGSEIASCRNASLFSTLFLCLSRACHGKMIISSIEWRKRDGGFRTFPSLRFVSHGRALSHPATQPLPQNKTRLSFASTGSFPMFVPSLSWQNERSVKSKQMAHKRRCFSHQSPQSPPPQPGRSSPRPDQRRALPHAALLSAQFLASARKR